MRGRTSFRAGASHLMENLAAVRKVKYGTFGFLACLLKIEYLSELQICKLYTLQRYDPLLKQKPSKKNLYTHVDSSSYG